MTYILTHGDNKHCPEVQAGKWPYCRGHHIPDERDMEARFKSIEDRLNALEAAQPGPSL